MCGNEHVEVRMVYEKNEEWAEIYFKITVSLQPTVESSIYMIQKSITSLSETMRGELDEIHSCMKSMKSEFDEKLHVLRQEFERDMLSNRQFISIFRTSIETEFARFVQSTQENGGEAAEE